MFMKKNIGSRLRRRGLKKVDSHVAHIDREASRDLAQIGDASKGSIKADEKFWAADVKAQVKSEESSNKQVENSADEFVDSFDPDKQPKEAPEEDDYADVPAQEVEANVEDQPRHEEDDHEIYEEMNNAGREKKEVVKEAAEHPSLPKETVEQIVEDHEVKKGYNKYYVGHDLKGLNVKVYGDINQNQNFFKKATSDSEFTGLNEYEAVEKSKDLIDKGYEVKAIHNRIDDKFDLWFYQY